MNYRTVNLPFVVSGEVARKLLFTGWLFRCAVTTGFEHVRRLNMYMSRSDVTRLCYRVCSRFLKSSYYVQGACNVVHEIVASCEELKVPLTDVEFSNWLLVESHSFRKNGKLYTAIEIIDEHRVTAKLHVDYNNVEEYTIVTHGAGSRRFRQMLLDAVAEQDYHCRIYINGWSKYRIGGVVQVAIPERIWLRYAVRDHVPVKLEEVEYVLGFDVNFDRVNWMLVDLDCNIIDMDTIWFPHLVTQGARRKGVRGYVIQKLHKLFAKLKLVEKRKLAVAVEKSHVLCMLKLVWIRYGKRKHEHYNYRVARFRARLIEDIKQVARLYSLPAVEVDPRRTTRSEEHVKVMSRFGLDRHMASAYLIAKRAITKLRG